MKTIIALVAAFQLSLGAFGQVMGPREKPGKYCAALKKGEKVVMYRGAALTNPITLKDGTVIQTDGNVVHRDGNITVMRTGECVNEDGVIVEKKPK